MDKLTKYERLLLNGLIHGDDSNWWNVVPNVESRNKALKNLINTGLIECHKKKGMRATDLGIKANESQKDNQSKGYPK
jgi:predicted transcriptional regulator with HTH domain